MYRSHSAALGCWMQVDPKAEGAYSQTPYNSMWNNPVSYSDPNGDFAFLGYAAASVAVNGIGNVIKGNNFFQGWAGAAVGGALSGGIGGAIGNAISSHLPSINFQAGDFSFSISPSFSFGSNGWGVGASLGANYFDGNFSAGIGIGGGYGKHSLGSNSVSGFYGNIGGGIGYSENGGGWNSLLYSNQTFGRGIGQRVAGFRLGFKNSWHIAYENDGAPFPNGSKLNDAHDRFRTNAVSIGVLDVDLRLNMFTGDPVNSFNNLKDPKYPHGVWDGGAADKFRLGALSLGYNGNRIGLNGEGIRHTFQNKFAHTEHKVLGMKFLRNQTYFRHLGGGYRAYSETSTFSNPYSLWSF